MKRHFAILFSLVCLFITGCATTGGGGGATGKLTILFTGGRELEIEPCGCSMGPLGGMDREANFLAQVKKTEKNVLTLGAGTMFIPNPITPKLRDHYLRKADFVIEGLGALGLQVFSPSGEDTWYGAKALKDLEAKSKFPWVSANLLQNGQPLFRRYVELKTADGVSVWVTGVTEKPKTAALQQKEIEIAPASETLKSVLAELSGKPGLVVVFAPFAQADKAALAKQFPRINLLLGQLRGEEESRVIQAAPDTIMYGVRGSGKTVTRLDLTYHSGLVPFRNEEVAYATKAEKGSLFRFDTIELEEKYAQPENELSKLIERYRATVKKATLESEAAEDKKPAKKKRKKSQN